MIEKKSFEQLTGELEALVARLESGDVPLEQGLQSYQEGMKLVKEARALLTAYELKVEQIINAQGETELLDVS